MSHVLRIEYNTNTDRAEIIDDHDIGQKRKEVIYMRDLIIL